MIFLKKIVFITSLLSSMLVLGQKNVKVLTANNTEIAPVFHSNVWKYHQGDDATWANYDFDDTTWDTLDITLNLNKIPKETFTGNCWFRLKLITDSSITEQLFSLSLSHKGASEIYMDGKLVHRFGKVGLNKASEQPFSPNEIPIGINFDQREYHIIAIRYSNQYYLENYEKYDAENAGISISIDELNDAFFKEFRSKITLVFTSGLMFAILFTLSFVHFLLFIFYKKHKVNLYYSLFTFIFSLLFFCAAFQMMVSNSYLQLFIEYNIYMLIPLLFFMLITFLYSLFYVQFPKIFWATVVLTFFSILLYHFRIEHNEIIITTQALFIIIESIRVIIRAIIKKYKGANILGVGIFLFAAFIVGIILLVLSTQGNINFTFNGPFGLLIAVLVIFTLLSIPISMSVYLAKDFSTINKDLNDEKEKLEQRVIERTAEVVAQKEVVEKAHALLEEKNEEIMASIRYAKRIQDAIMTSKKYIERNIERLKSTCQN